MSYTFTTKSALQTAINDWISNETSAAATYGDINTWDVSAITDMSQLFSFKSTFNSNISNWNVSNVTVMSQMFWRATSFNQDISGWNVSNVTDMRSMFDTASSFNQPIGNWNVSNVWQMFGMFQFATSFNQEIRTWTLNPNGVNLSAMFQQATAFTNNYNVSSTPSQSFWNSYFTDNNILKTAVNAWISNPDSTEITYGNITTWNVLNITDMSGLFQNKTTFNSNISNWNTSNVNNMSNIFDGAISFTQDISTWDVSSVTNMSGMFKDISFNPNISNWIVTNVTDMSDMFLNNKTFNTNIRSWDINNVINFSNMFNGADAFINLFEAPITPTRGFWNSYFISKNQLETAISEWIADETASIIKYDIINNWNVSNITDMSGLFLNKTTFNYNINNWNTTNVTDMTNMFKGATNFNNEIRAWEVSNVNNFTDMFNGADTFKNTFNISTNTPSYVFWNGYFTNNIELKNAVNLFLNDESNALITYGNIDNWEVSNITDMSGLFLNKSSFNSNISNWNTSNVTDMYQMFSGCFSFNQDIGGWNVSNVTNMADMFKNAVSFTQNIGSWNVSNVTNMNSMLNNVTVFNQDIRTWDVTNVTDFTNMFENSNSFKSKFSIEDTPTIAFWNSYFIDNNILKTAVDLWTTNQSDAITNYRNINTWEVSNITDMSGLFQNKNTFNSNITNWNVSNVTNMANMFNGASLFNQNINHWNVSNVTNMSSMFKDTTSFNQPLNDWDVSSVTNMSNMFENNSIFNKELREWHVINVTDFTDMFKGATNFQDTYVIGDTPLINFFIIYTPSNKTELVNSINDWITNESNALDTYGDIIRWNIINITDLSEIFKNKNTFNSNIYLWNTSNVTNLSSMFEGATSFNRDISGWNLSSATNISSMFKDATSFNQNINDWNVSSVTNMSSMFSGASSFVKDISSWNVSNVTDFSSMFKDSSFNQDISSWNVSSATNMSSMFSGTHFNQDISGWNVSNVTDFSTMFKDSSFNQSIRMWNTENATNLSEMFNNNINFNIDIRSWSVTNVTNYIDMFKDANTFKTLYNVGNTPTSDFFTFLINDRTDLNNKINQWLVDPIFFKRYYGDINQWNVSNITDMSGLFQDKTTFNSNISNWNVSNVTNMENMFRNATSFNQNITAWNTSLVTNMSNMFNNASSIDFEIRSLNVSNVTNFNNMFLNATSLISRYSLITYTPISAFFTISPTYFNTNISLQITGTINENSYSNTILKNNITSIEFGSGITKIDDNTFSNASRLNNITITPYIKEIGKNAFINTPLTNIYFEEIFSNSQLSIIDENAFYNTDISNISFPDSLEQIKTNAFHGSNLENITISNKIQEIGDDAFGYIESLKSIDVCGNNNYYSDLSGILFNKNKTVLIRCPPNTTLTSFAIPSSVITIKESAFYNVDNITSLTFDDISNSQLKIIENNAFSYMSNLNNLILPEGLIEIDDYAFSHTSISSITIPSTVITIKNNTFDNAINLQSVNVYKNNNFNFTGGYRVNFYGINEQVNIVILDPSSTIITPPAEQVKEITTMKYKRKSFVSGLFTLENITTKIRTAAFYKSNLSTIVLHNNVTLIERMAFAETLISNITIPLLINRINFGCFFDCDNLSNVIMHENISYIGELAFSENNSLKDISLSNVKHIEEYAFKNTPLENVDLKNIKYIGIEAFSNCNITKLVLGKNLTEIKRDTFINNNLSKIILPKNLITYTVGSFNNNRLNVLNDNPIIVYPSSITNFDILNFGNTIYKYDITNSKFKKFVNDNEILNFNMSDDISLNSLETAGYELIDLYNSGYILENIINQTSYTIKDALIHLPNTDLINNIKNLNYTIFDIRDIGQITNDKLQYLFPTYSLIEIRSAFTLQTMYDNNINLNILNPETSNITLPEILLEIDPMPTLTQLASNNYDPYHLYPTFDLSSIYHIGYTNSNDYIKLVELNSNFSLDQLTVHFSYSTIKNTNYNVNKFYDASGGNGLGYTVYDLNFNGNKSIDFFTDSKYSRQQIVDGSFNVSDYLRLNYTAEELNQNYNINNLFSGGYSENQILIGNFPINSYYNYDSGITFTPSELKVIGNRNANELIDSSYSNLAILNASFTTQELYDASFQMEFFYLNTNYSIFDVCGVYPLDVILTDSSFSIQNYKDAGFSAFEINLYRDVSISQLTDVSYSRQEIIDASFSVRELYDNDYELNELIPTYPLNSSIQNVFTSTTILQSNYTLEDFYNAPSTTSLPDGNGNEYTVTELKTLGNKNVSFFVDSSYVSKHPQNLIDISDLPQPLTLYSVGNVLDAYYDISAYYDASFHPNIFAASSVGYDLSVVKLIYDADILLNDTNYTFQELAVDGSFTVFEFNTIGNRPVTTIFNNQQYFSISNILNGGYDISQIYFGGFNESYISWFFNNSYPNSPYKIIDLYPYYGHYHNVSDISSLLLARDISLAINRSDFSSNINISNDISYVLQKNFPINTFFNSKIPTIDLNIIGNKTVDELLDTSYSKLQIFEGSFNVVDLSNSGFSALDFKITNNYDLIQLQEAYTKQEIILAKFPINNYYDASFTVTELRTLGNYDISSVRYKILDVSNLIDISNVTDISNHSKYTIEGIVDGGYSVQNLFNSDISASYLAQSGKYNINLLKNIYSKEEIIKSGFSVTEYKNGNYSAFDLNVIGNYSVFDISNIYTNQSIIDASYTINDLLSINIPVSEYNYSSSPYNVSNLSAYYNRSDIINAEFPINQYYNANFTIIELKNIGNYPPSKFIPSNYLLQDVFNAGYSINDLSNSGLLTTDNVDELAIAGYNSYDLRFNYTGDNLIDLLKGYSYNTLISQGYLPSQFDLTSFTSRELYEDSIPASGLYATNYPVNNLLRDSSGELYSLLDLSNSGYEAIKFVNAFNGRNNNSITFTVADLVSIYDYNTLGPISIAENNAAKLRSGKIAISNFYSPVKINVSYIKQTGESNTNLESLNSNTDIRHLLLVSGFTALDLYNGGYNIIEISRASGLIGTTLTFYSKSELLDLRAPINTFSSVVSDLTGYNGDTLGYNNNSSYSLNINDLKQYYNLLELFNAGYTVAILKDSGFTTTDFFNFGFELNAAIAENYSVNEILAGGYSTDALASVQSSAITAEALLGVGVTICNINSFNKPNRTWERFENTPHDYSYTFDEYNMRRKAETLKYNKNAFDESDKNKFKNILKGRTNCRGIAFSNQSGNSDFNTTNPNSLNLPRENNTLIFNNFQPQGIENSKSSRNSDVPGKTTQLYLDPNVPLKYYTKRYTYDDNDKK